MENNKFSAEQLKGFGLTDEQIAAIANQSDVVIQNAQKSIPKIADVSEITTIANLSEYAKGNVVRLPDFSEGQPFVVKLRRPSMLVLMKNGKIPNSLLQTASNLFDGSNKNDSSATQESISKMYDVMKIIAEASLISPTMEEITNAGIELTDEQLIAIFNYSQRGINGLQSFRE